MSDGNRSGIDLARLASLRMNDTEDLLDFNPSSGAYSKTLEDGTVINITVKNGKIVQHEARDKEGHPLRPYYVNSSPGDPGAPEARVCYACYIKDPSWDGPGGFCVKIPRYMM